MFVWDPLSPTQGPAASSRRWEALRPCPWWPGPQELEVQWLPHPLSGRAGQNLTQLWSPRAPLLLQCHCRGREVWLLAGYPRGQLRVSRPSHCLLRIYHSPSCTCTSRESRWNPAAPASFPEPRDGLVPGDVISFQANRLNHGRSARGSWAGLGQRTPLHQDLPGRS